MNKAIYIGQLTLNVTLPTSGDTAGISIGDRAVSAAMINGRSGIETLYISEVADDAIGRHIISVLNSAYVDTTSVDRYTEGASPVRVTARGNDSKAVLHAAYPAEPVNPIWPRINPGDTVAYGSFMTLDRRNHQRILELLGHAQARKAHTVCLPYFDTMQVPRTTRVMPEVWECLEAASLVIATAGDIAILFPGESTAQAYRDHILFYCPKCIILDHSTLTVHYHEGDTHIASEPTAASFRDNQEQWAAACTAAAVRALTLGISDPHALLHEIGSTGSATLHTGI